MESSATVDKNKSSQYLRNWRNSGAQERFNSPESYNEVLKGEPHEGRYSMGNEFYDDRSAVEAGLSHEHSPPMSLADPDRTNPDPDRTNPDQDAPVNANFAALRQLEGEQSPITQPSPSNIQSAFSPPNQSNADEPSTGDTLSLPEEGIDIQSSQEDKITLNEDDDISVHEEDEEMEREIDSNAEHRRSPSGASTRTFQPSLFNDFDGAYCPSFVEAPEEADTFDTYGDTSRNTWAEPPPRDSMVYYPAPVPKTLNLPQRLSFVPPPSTQAKRRTQILDSMPAQARQSAIWLTHPADRNSKALDTIRHSTVEQRESNRTSKRTSALPAHLRASAFFERPSIPQDIPIKDESAVRALDDFLNESASMPADAFTDHPIVGNVLRDVYAKELAKESARKSTYSTLNTDKLDFRKSKSLITNNRLSMQPFRRMAGRTNSRPDLDRLQNNANAEKPLGDIHTEDSENQTKRRNTDRGADHHDYDIEDGPGAKNDEEDDNEEDEDDDEGEEDDDDAEEDEDEENEDEGITDHQRDYGPPTTLLAELQIRKAELKQRNRTAVQAFPNGMHATLLELDAVAQVEKKRRKAQRTALAWEDPTDIAAAAEAGGDDEIPLGVLFPPKNRLINRVGGDDWDRPLGLIEKKHRDDNEPLSSRRNRLRGISPNKNPPNPLLQLPDQDAEEDNSEHEGETLAERTRRLKTLDALDSAIRKSRPSSAEFATEMMSQFGISQEPVESETTADQTKDRGEIEETLGQRRRRLKAEEQARQLTSDYHKQGPPVSTMTYANLLSAYPTTAAVRNSNEPTPQGRFVGRQGGLLSLNEQYQAQQRHELIKHNAGIAVPSSENVEQMDPSPAFSGLLAQDDQIRSKLRREMSTPNIGIRLVPSESQQPQIAPHSLLGFHDQQRNYQREQIMEQSRQNASFVMADPSMAQPKMHYAGGRFNDGTGGIVSPPPAYDALQQTMFYNNMNMRLSSPNLGYGANHFPGYPQMMQQPAMPTQYGMPMIHPGYYPPMMQDVAPMMEEPPLDHKQVEAIENWRQSVM